MEDNRILAASNDEEFRRFRKPNPTILRMLEDDPAWELQFDTKPVLGKPKFIRVNGQLYCRVDED